MSITATISGVSVSIIESSLSFGDKVDERGACSFNVLDTTGTTLYHKFSPVIITDSVLGDIFTGVVSKPKLGVKFFPNPHRTIQYDCIDPQYRIDKITSNWIYKNQYAGTVAVDQIQRYGNSEGVTAAAALDWDETTTDWSAGTLSGTHATTNASNGNVGGGDLELSLAGSTVTFLQESKADFDAGLAASGMSSVVGGGAQLTSSNAIKFAANCTIPSLTNAYTYLKIWSGSYTIAATDIISYDIWLPSGNPEAKAAVDFLCSDGSTFRDSLNNGTDAQGLSMHPKTDLSGFTDQWYSRSFFIDNGGGFTGKTISSVLVAFEGESTGSYAAYFRNIKIMNGVTLKLSVFASTDTATQTTPQQLQTNGYADVSCSVVTTYEKHGFMDSFVTSLTNVGIVQSSRVAWDVTVPDGCSLTITASIDGFRTFLPCTNGGAIPGLIPGANMSGKDVWFVYTMDNSGTDPTITPFLSRISASVYPSYSSSKSDIITMYDTSTDWLTGTLSSAIIQDGSAIRLSGYARNWDDASTSNQTVYGASSPSTSILRRQFVVTSGNNNDARVRFDFAGNWQDFTAEIDITLPAASVQMGFVYRTTGWQNANNTFAYMVVITTANIVLGRGTNTGSGAGAFTSISNVAVTLTANQTYRLKIVVAGNSHQAYINDVRYINATDSTYTATGNIGLRLVNTTGVTTSGTFDNFGVVAALSGTWTSPAIDIHTLGTISNSALALQIDPGVNLSMCKFQAEISLNNGSSYTVLTNLQGDQSGYYQAYPVTGLTSGTNVSGITQAKIRLTLSATTASVGETIAATAPVLPKITDATLFVIGAYSSSGTRISPALALSAVNGRANDSLVNWNANLPTNTSLTVESTINNGSSWQSVADAGNAITGITLAPDPTVDFFTTNTSASYTATHGTGGADATSWTWDAANKRLVSVGGTRAVLLRNSLTVTDVDFFADIKQAQNSGLIWRYSSASNYYELVVKDSANGNSFTLIKMASGTPSTLATGSIAFPTGTHHYIRVKMLADVITAYFDGNQILTTTDGSPIASGQVGLRSDTGTSYVYQLRIQPQGQDVSAISVKTRLTLTTTDPTVTPQVLDLQCFVSSSDIGIGSLITDTLDYRTTYVSANVSDLKTKSNYWFYIRTNNSLVFQSSTAMPSAWPLDSANYQTLGGVQINDVLIAGVGQDYSADLYRNRQILKNVQATSTFAKSFVGDGQTATWNTDYPLAGPPSAWTLNGVPVSFARKDISPIGSDFYYQIGSTALDQDAGGAKLTSADVLAIDYDGLYAKTITRDNATAGTFSGTTAQDELAAIDSTSGIVTNIEDVGSRNMNESAAEDYGDSLLQRYGVLSGLAFTFTTLRSGLLPGQQLSCYVSELNIDDTQALITEVKISQKMSPVATGGNLYYFAVSCTTSANLGSWVKLLSSALAG